MKRTGVLAVLLGALLAVASPGEAAQKPKPDPRRPVTQAKTRTPPARETVRGPKGDRGEAGEKGDKGDRGDRGDKGDRGDPAQIPQWLVAAAGLGLGLSLLGVPALVLGLMNFVRLSRHLRQFPDSAPLSTLPSSPPSSQLVQVLHPPAWVKSVDVRIGVGERGAAPASPNPGVGKSEGPTLDAPLQELPVQRPWSE